MVKKLFALASVTALTGVFAATASTGCSSETTEVPGDSDSGPKADAGKKETSTPGDNEEDDTAECPKNIEFDPTGLEQEIGTYKAPKGFGTGDCTAADLAQFKTNLGNKALEKWTDLTKDLSASCAGCALTSTDKANWGLIVTLAPDNEKGLINWGACHAGYHNTAACGVGVMNFQICLDNDCPDDCGAAGSTQANACNTKSQTSGSCKATTEKMGTDCPQIAKSEPACGSTPLTHLTALCGGSKDGGTD